ncbi:MAG: ABC transporter permease [Gammaproteobacteria bacterium]
MRSGAGNLLSVALVIWGVISLVFFLIHLVPGDPVEAMLGESARPADREALRHALKLDLPIATQYANYLSSLRGLDLGESISQRRPVAEVISERLPATLVLAMASIAVAVMLAAPLGLMAAWKRGGVIDQGASLISVLGVAIPNFALGPVLVLILALGTGWFPVSGWESPLSLVLPALTLGSGLAAVLARMLRSSLLEVLHEDYMRTARAKGLGRFQAMLGHGLRNAMLPVLTLLGIQLGAVLGGAVVTETVFDWPGLGRLTIEAIEGRDYPLVQGCVLVIAVIYVLVNLTTDLLYRLVDPRIRRAMN